MSSRQFLVQANNGMMLPCLQKIVQSAIVWRCLAAVLIAGAAGFRLAYLIFDCPLDLAPDEAHYWDWSRHLDWSYYSKGPLVAWLIRLGCWSAGQWSEQLVGSQMVAVRLPAIVCGGALLASLYVLTVQVFRRDWLAFLVVAIALTLPVIAAGSVLMTIDAPYTCCWGWALVLAYHAVFNQSKWAWPMLGAVVGLGVLAKYTMVLFFPSLGLFLLFSTEHRHCLRRPGLWISVMVGVLLCMPILFWNMQHDWVTLRHAQGHAGMKSEGGTLYWLGPLKYVAVQFALFLGYWFVVWACAMWQAAPWRNQNKPQQYLWWMSAPMFGFFLAFSIVNNGGEANWPIAAYISGMALVAGWLRKQWMSPLTWQRRFSIGATCVAVVISLSVTVVAHYTSWSYPLLSQLTGPPTPARRCPLRRIDPTCRLRGWRALAAKVDVEMQKLRAQKIEPVLAAGYWNVPGELAFYCSDNPEVYCLGAAMGTRHSQYDFWRPNPIADQKQYYGRTFVFVGDPTRLIEQRAFEYVEQSGVIVHKERSHPIAVWHIFVCHRFRGFGDIDKNRKY